MLAVVDLAFAVAAATHYNEGLAVKRFHLKPVAVALVAVLGALACWTFLIHYSPRGEWSSMFLTSAGARIPEPLKSENIYVFPASVGYDGQFYHFLAHDPWLTRGFLPSVDNPPLRWRRILVGVLAWALALGLAALWRARGWLRPVLAAWGLFGVLLTATASLDVFQDAFSPARLLSPLILLLAADGAARRDWLAAAPMILTAPRIAMPLASQALGILCGVYR